MAEPVVCSTAVNLPAAIPAQRIGGPEDDTPVSAEDRDRRRHVDDASFAESPVRQADRLALALKEAVERVSVPLAGACSVFLDARGWFDFGYARLDDYARERFDRSGQWIRDMAALGSGLRRLPGLAQAFSGTDGRKPLGRVAATCIARVASEDSLDAWLELARWCTVRELTAAASRARAAGSEWPDSCPHVPANDGGARLFAPESVGEPESVDMPAGENDSPDSQGRTLVRILVPLAVRAAFDETLLLHRAVSGHEACVTSFVEALVAEAYAGACPPDADASPLKRSPGEAMVESALARAADAWSGLPATAADPGQAGGTDGAPSTPGSWEVNLQNAARVLSRLEQCTRRGETPDGAGADALIRELLRLEDDLQRQLGRLLRDMADRGAWKRLMFAGVGHYAEQRLGLGRTATSDRARLARALDRYPRLRDAYETGALRTEAALIVVRVLDRENVEPSLEHAWVLHASECTVKRLRDEARVLRRRQAREPGVGHAQPIDDDDWHASLRLDPGTLRGRVLDLGRRAATAGNPDVLIGLRLPDDLAHGLLASVDHRRRALTRSAATVPWEQPWPDDSAPPSLLAAREFHVRCRRAPAWVGLLALLEEYVTVWDDPQAMPRRKSIEIYSRDGWRCMAPGCTSRRNLEDHHLNYRSRGGGDETPNRVCTCRFHHQRGEHGALARCRGRAPTGVVWRLGRRDLAEMYRNERRLSSRRDPQSASPAGPEAGHPSPTRESGSSK